MFSPESSHFYVLIIDNKVFDDPLKRLPPEIWCQNYIFLKATEAPAAKDLLGHRIVRLGGDDHVLLIGMSMLHQPK